MSDQIADSTNISRTLEQHTQSLREIGEKIDRVFRYVETVRRRQTITLEPNIVLTYLEDDIPIYVNSNDDGCPTNLINNGMYETETYQVLRSFSISGTKFADIGANLGVFSLRLAPILQRGGEIFSFEPHPLVGDLFSRSIYLNGFNSVIHLERTAVSDKPGRLALQYEERFVGGGSVYLAPGAARTTVEREALVIDDYIAARGNRLDLVKIDVEGYEFHVLNGMRRVISANPHIAIVFENLHPGSPQSRQVEDLLREVSLDLFGVGPRASLQPLASLTEFSGNVLAISTAAGPPVLDRRFFEIGASQMNILHGGTAVKDIGAGMVIFHGPYWYIERGTWAFEFEMELDGTIDIHITEQFGCPVAKFRVSGNNPSVNVIIDHDLLAFEVVGRTADVKARNVELVKIHCRHID